MTVAGRIQTGIGIAGAALLVSLVVFPGLVPLPASLAGLEPPGTNDVRYVVAAVLGITTLAFVVVSLRRGPTSGTDVDPFVVDAPEEIHGRTTGYPHPDVDASFERLVEGDADVKTVTSLSSDLRETAVRLYAAETGRSHDEAAAAVDSGRWTVDARAAAFVATDSDPLPLRSRLWDYVRPENADHRRARHAVEALEALAAGEGSTDSVEGDR